MNFIQDQKQPFPLGLIEDSNVPLAALGVIEYSCLPMEIILTAFSTVESELFKVLLSILAIYVALNHPKGQAYKSEKYFKCCCLSKLTGENETKKNFD